MKNKTIKKIVPTIKYEPLYVEVIGIDKNGFHHRMNLVRKWEHTDKFLRIYISKE